VTSQAIQLMPGLLPRMQLEGTYEMTTPAALGASR
jgi:hypothetical protein